MDKHTEEVASKALAHLRDMARAAPANYYQHQQAEEGVLFLAELFQQLKERLAKLEDESCGMLEADLAELQHENELLRERLENLLIKLHEFEDALERCQIDAMEECY